MIFGLDYLGGAKYGDLILREHPFGWAAGFFLNVDGFGDASKVIVALAATGRCPHIRIHGLWKDHHDFTSKDIPLAVSRAKIVQSFQTRFPNIRWEYSAFCENNDVRLSEQALTECQKVAPNVRMVHSPNKGKSLSKKFKNEVHGTEAKAPVGRYNFSFDGASQVDADVETIKERHSESDVFFMWDPTFNGRYETKDTTKRPKRKAWPNSDVIDSLIAQSLPKQRSWVSKNFPKGFLYKSHADYHDKDAKSHRPVILDNRNVPFIDFQLANGQVVERIYNKGRYEDGKRWRYFGGKGATPGQFGYLIAEKAKRISGGPHVRIKIGDDNSIILHPAFREGDYRKE